MNLAGHKGILHMLQTTEHYIKHPEKITNVYGIHPHIIPPAIDRSPVFSMIPHYFYEFNNDQNSFVVYAGANLQDGKNIFRLSSEELRNFLRSIPDLNAGTKILFDNLYEGNFLYAIDLIYRAIDNTSIQPDQIHYFSGAMNSNQLLEIYCAKHQCQKINVYACNSWEYYIQNNISKSIVDYDYKIQPKDKLFVCFNRVARTHRYALFGLLNSSGLVDQSYYSFFDGCGHVKQIDISYVMSTLRQNLSSGVYETVHEQYEKHKDKFPLKLNIDADLNKNYIDSDDFQYINNSYFSLVTETFFFDLPDEEAVFFSEKIFKPIALKHPFILAGKAHSLKWLQHIGYKTFHPFINETYDTIENHNDRLVAIVEEVKRLSQMTTAQWIDWQKNVQSIVEYNYQRLLNKPKYQFAITRPYYNTRFEKN